ncbi:alkylated DNA repair protein (DNA oxidative demethylase) [Rubricella aquisinus]|uniref:Alkylated DNA repair protein (DNA oxidative demethylase) n=1 Tax=Rubricella aquisinus TaxID=2028108 RepID=A0A840WXQ2_9RHOB|nr:alpha-ketoglutarate-dependent dioxygenase AlkB [Rubricella aquisinus]MBB5514456.1 alkylated DNA repair protein (DNA oxidative demethylase) [Rubricella aquisinus]
MEITQKVQVGGAVVYPGALSRDAQMAMVEDVRGIARAAPFFSPLTPWGKPMRVRMTSAGRFGWWSDRKGYRYIPTHPSGSAWPAIPGSILAVWDAVADAAPPPECCLVNYYCEGAKMGLHQDKDEANFAHPVVSISLGDTATFRIGGTERGGKTQSIALKSGDVLVMGGATRLAYHGIDRIKFGSSPLLPDGGRINLTLRVVT